mmetsp:Transcript_20274/g.17954  ORF Transcript_20274/g.17954 Transcript_20274/m.17954 type:complete len:347 (+) Transcript_20274:21-1061(+)
MPLESKADYQEITGDELIKDIDKDKPIATAEFNETKSIALAILAALFYSFHNLFIGSLADLGYLARCISGIGMMIPALVYYSKEWFLSYRNGESYFTFKKSVFINKHTDTFGWFILLGVLLSITSTFLGGVSVIYSFKFALEASTNQGVISSIFGLTPFVVAVLFYFVFKEYLKISHIVGMLFIIACILLIALGVKDHKTRGDVSKENSSAGIYAIFFAILCPFFFAFNGLVVRLVRNRYEVDPKEFTQVFLMLQGCLLIIATIVICAVNGYIIPLWDFLQMLLAGVMVNFGRTSMNMAITCGNAGVAYSLNNLQVVFYIILSSIVFLQIPTGIEILAAVLGITGS